MMHFVHDVPACRVIFGLGSIDQVLSEINKLGASKVLVISGGPESEYADAIEHQLGDLVVGRYTDVIMHVPVENANRAAELSREVGADLLLAVGGGSSIGTAKAIAKTNRTPIIAVPTTYAGSEMTSIWGLTEGARKTTGRDLGVLPVTVIYDPTVTLSLPVDISVASGMNAMAHLVEAMYAPNVSPISLLQAEAGVFALASSLPTIAAEPENLEARSEAMFGAWLAGWALGTTGMGIHHKICHTLGGTYNTPHAQTHSAVLSYAIDFNRSAAPEAMKRISSALARAGFDEPNPAAAMWELAAAIGAPTCIGNYGFSRDDIPEATEIIVAAQPQNPRPVDADGVRELLTAACVGEKPKTQ